MKTGNNNSSLLDQLMKAAQSVESKPKSNFADDIFKAAKVKTASVHEIITAALMKKKAQVDPVAPPIGGPDGELGGPELDSGLDTGLEGTDASVTGGDEEAKKKVAEALVSLCGGDVEACCEFIKSCCGQPEEIGLPEDASLGTEPGLDGGISPAPAPEAAPMPMPAPRAF